MQTYCKKNKNLNVSISCSQNRNTLFKVVGIKQVDSSVMMLADDYQDTDCGDYDDE